MLYEIHSPRQSDHMQVATENATTLTTGLVIHVVCTVYSGWNSPVPGERGWTMRWLERLAQHVVAAMAAADGSGQCFSSLR